MGRNVEIKARCRSLMAFAARLKEMKAAYGGKVDQVDTYYFVRHGRLKLRTAGKGRGELIHYHRPDRHGPSLSRYSIFRTRDAAALGRQLTEALGVLGVVKKRRRVYLLGQTRVHLDEVRGIGGIIELEVVLRRGQSRAQGRAVANRLMRALGIKENDLISGSNIDLVAPRRAGAGRTVP